MHYFDHEKLDCYRVAMQALVLVDKIARSLPRGYAKLKDQMQRASQGVVLLIAEASARSGADRAMRFKMSRSEAGEAGAALEAALTLRIANERDCTQARELLLRVSAMLWPLTRT
jgi:four helix bundle protein